MHLHVYTGTWIHVYILYNIYGMLIPMYMYVCAHVHNVIHKKIAEIFADAWYFCICVNCLLIIFHFKSNAKRIDAHKNHINMKKYFSNNKLLSKFQIKQKHIPSFV